MNISTSGVEYICLCPFVIPASLFGDGEGKIKSEIKSGVFFGFLSFVILPPFI